MARRSRNSPLGSMTVTVEGRALTALTWGEGLDDLPGTPEEEALLDEAFAQIDAYFRRERKDFDLPLAPKGTPFQRAVWQGLCEIPYGQCLTYGALAEKKGSVARAVGGACGANPIALVIPCHRVVGGSGKLVGFSSAKGIDDKRWLLDFESDQPSLPLG
ncbi:methylated-DNA--[protein]-cysteine S-methyltransferase [Limibacillus halophilus]|jgi:methylated-DNA-[protein]-cysteine S-methyltransferase